MNQFLRFTAKHSLFVLFCIYSLMCQGVRWRDVPLRSSVTHVQPMTGLVLWPHMVRELHQGYGASIQLEFAYCLPCKVVTGCSDDGTIQYDWTWFEHILDDVASRGHQLVARFRYEYPGSRDVDRHVRGATAVPDYIKVRDDYEETYNDVPGDGPTYYADWRNEELQRFTLQFYRDFAARYAHDSRLAFLEIGFGHWSEYHIYGTNLQLGCNFPSKAFQRTFLLSLPSAMQGLPWVIGIDAGDRRYSPVPDDEDLLGLVHGVFDDSFMHKGHELSTGHGYNERMWQASGGTAKWQAGPCGGEVSYYSRDDQRCFLNPDGMYGHTWEEQSSKYHLSFIIANDAPHGEYGTASRFREAGMAIGYRFRVTACQTNGRKTRITVTNQGVAPLYRDAYFAIGDVRSATSLSGLLPGDTLTVTIPASTAAGTPHIVSDAILPTQDIEYDAGVDD